MTQDLADYRARCFVNGAARHAKTGNFEPITGNFHERFLDHPWVRASIVEGWDRELRMHLIRVAKISYTRGLPVGDIEDLMPDKQWIEKAQKEAERYRKAGEWRNKNVPLNMDVDGMLKRFGFGDQK